MRVAIDMQGAQSSSSRFRGIGRYTMAFAQAVVRNRGDHEVILLLSGLFPEMIKPIREAFDGLLPPENILVWHAPGPVRDCDSDNHNRREIAELMREAFFANLQVDLLHISSFFEGYSDDCVTSIERFDLVTPVSITIYDLIPILNAKDYLASNPPFARHYQRKIDQVKKAKHHLAISEFSRQDAITHLDVSDVTCINISTAIDPNFQVKVYTDSQNCALLQKLGLTRSFLMCAGGADPRKNLFRFIQAFASLPVSTRVGHQLLFVGKMLKQEVVQLTKCAKSAGLKTDELKFTGYVSDEDLVQLYNLCKLYVFPSWYEGFGLPALEAMACGAPVIASNVTSLPEVIGLDAAMFNPLDTKSIAHKIQQALEDDAFRKALIENGLKQTKLFSWHDTAKRAIEGWEKESKQTINDEKSWCATLQHTNQIYKKLLEKLAPILSVDGDGLALQKISMCLAQNEKQFLSYLRRTILPNKIVWRLEGPFDSSYSLALVNREMARALFSLGHQVVLHSTDGPGDFEPNPQFLNVNLDLAAMHKLSASISGGKANVTSRNLYPPRVSNMLSRLNTLHAYAWEESGFPLDWVDEFNQCLQGMTANSNHVQKIMVDHGLTVPVAVSSLGVDHWQRVVVDQAFSIQAKSFRFLHVSSCFPRKGADVMLSAYGRAFRASDDVTLVIKTFNNPHHDIHKWLGDLKAHDPDFPHVQIIETDLSDGQLKSLYEQCHALVAPSRAEGFGLPMAEAMLSGLAVITTGWGGQTDFCTTENSWLIDYKFVRAQSHFGLWVSAWAEPDEDHLTQLLKVVYQTPQQQRENRSELGKKILLDRFCWSHAANRVVQASRQWSSEPFVPDLCVAWVSSWNTKCGIATYSEHLINNMPQDMTILAAHAALTLEPDGDGVKRCWVAGEADNLTELSNAVKRSQCNTLVIQFNYCFFNFEYFSDFLNDQVDSGINVVLMLHATQDPTHIPNKKLSRLTQAFNRCGRVLVHSINDLNRLKTMGLVDNVTLFPHGVIDFESISSHEDQGSNLKPQKNQFVVASYGFFLPNKGLLELIDALSLLRASGLNAQLIMVNAEYPIPESSSLIRQAKLKISEYGLQHAVTLSTDYISDIECIKSIARADLIVYPYQQTLESASGAVRYGMASGKPVAVTPLSIFDDVADATFILPGMTPEDLAKGILSIEKSLRTYDQKSKMIKEAALSWQEQHNYSRVGNRLSGLLQALNIQVANQK